MKFGVREIANVVFRAKQAVKIGTTTFRAGQPVLYIDSAKTSTLEGAATTVYAQGGRGNTRLVAWEGEKTLTFTVEDALLSPIGFSVLSGAGLFKGTENDKVNVHTTTTALVDAVDYTIDLTDALGGATLSTKAPLFVLGVEKDGSLNGNVYSVSKVEGNKITLSEAEAGLNVMVDYYAERKSANVSEIQIDAENFAGNYYVEADTLFRDTDGVDLPANITLPNVKIQSNFTFTMAATGDPSTFTFTMDAFPGYTYFNKDKQVLCVIQVIEDFNTAAVENESVMLKTKKDIDLSKENGTDTEDSWKAEDETE
jgi:hypothetical protein